MSENLAKLEIKCSLMQCFHFETNDKLVMTKILQNETI